jgi:hypothetical protein
MLQALSLLIRTLFAFALVAAAPALVGFFVAGSRGAAYGAGLGVLALVFGSFIAEEGAIRALGATERGALDFTHSLERALVLSGWPVATRAPRVLFYQDPGPGALFVRAPLGAGAVLLSQGLVSALDEEELRALFAEACARARAPGVALRSLCFWLALGLARAGSLEWASVVFLGARQKRGLEPQAALRFAAVFPWMRLLVRLASVPSGVMPSDAAQRSESYAGALRKIEHARRLHGSTHNFAASFAGLVNLSMER